jgi:hypothetical protein
MLVLEQIANTLIIAILLIGILITSLARAVRADTQTVCPPEESRIHIAPPDPTKPQVSENQSIDKGRNILSASSVYIIIDPSI